jgi:hypothetical protein
MNFVQDKIGSLKLANLLILCLSTINLIMWGCAASIEDNSKVIYKNDSFSRAELYEGGLAVMPVTAAGGVEGYRRPFGESLDEYLIEYKPKEVDFNTLEWEESSDQLNESGLTQKYNDAILAYKKTSVIDYNLLKEIGETFEVKYLLFTELGDFSDESNYKYDWFLGHGYGVRKVGMFAYCTIWDCNEGDIVWECVGDISSTSGHFTYVSESEIKNFSNMAAESIITRLYHVLKKSR